MYLPDEYPPDEEEEEVDDDDDVDEDAEADGGGLAVFVADDAAVEDAVD